MAYNLIPYDRQQQFLLPPSLEDWLPHDHLVRFVIDVVGQLDLAPFYRRHRADGWGRAAYDPKMMVALLVYAYCTGVRSSREIERRCREDIAFRFIAANRCPDHATVARFRSENGEPLAGLFIQALQLCAEAGLVRVEMVALDGKRVKADASMSANKTRTGIEEEVKAIPGLLELCVAVHGLLHELAITDGLANATRLLVYSTERSRKCSAKPGPGRTICSRAPLTPAG